MIVQWFLDMIGGVLDAILGWVPAPQIPDVAGYLGQLGPLFQWVGWLNRYLPIELTLNLSLVLLGMMVLRQTMLFAIWSMSKLHVLGGGSE